MGVSADFLIRYFLTMSLTVVFGNRCVLLQNRISRLQEIIC